MRFTDREQAGKKLADALERFRGTPAVVYGLPRGGVATAAEVARGLGAPLDLLIPRKIGHPVSPEYAVAAVTETGPLVSNETEVAALDPAWLAHAEERERAEARRRRETYVGTKPPADVRGKTAIVVDDGIATGLTMRAAIGDLRKHGPKRIVVAAPVAPADTIETLRRDADDVVVLHVPPGMFGAVGAYYDAFPQLTDETVTALLQHSGS
jgi:putative phosphoribosyl transferase